MATGTLRKVGGSVMIAIPPAILDLAKMQVDMEVGLTVSDGNIIIQTKQRKSLAALIAQCDSTRGMVEREWVDAPAVGDELL